MKKDIIEVVLGMIVILLIGAAMFAFTIAKHNEYIEHKRDIGKEDHYVIGYKYIEDNLYEVYDDYSIYPCDED